MAKLLIVDDEKNIRGHLARFFRERGYDAQTAESGPQALAMFSDRAAEVVLTDYRMAEMNGHDLLKRIRERDPNVMVILMTAYATVENAVATMKEGAYDYLTKPFSLEQVEHAALRERPEDILSLAERLLSAAAIRNRRAQLRFSSEASSALAQYRWPGNVRELRNAVERAAVLSDMDLVGLECLPDTLFQPAPGAPPANSSSNLEELEREQIVRVLAQSPTLQDAAETLGINVTTLWRKRKRYKLDSQ